MKLGLITGVLFLLASACAVGGPASDDGGAPMARKRCGTPNAMYAVTFTKLNGNCPNIDDRVSYQWVDENYHPVMPSNCSNHGEYDTCTSYVNEDCKTWVYDEQLYGQLNWYPGGGGAEGVLTFVAFELQNGYLYCSSQYQTNYTLQWSSPIEDGGTE